MPAKHANKRSEFQKAYDRQRIAEMYLEGMYQDDIGKAVGLSQGQISGDLAFIQKQWLENTTMKLDEHKAKELAKIDNLERTYWLDRERYLAAWESSRIERTKKRQRKSAKGVIDASIETEQRDGNPAFLDGMLKCNAGIDSCIDRRCKLLGLNAPTKSELTGKDGGPIQTEQVTKPDLSKLSLEELLNLRQMMSKATDGITEPV